MVVGVQFMLLYLFWVQATDWKVVLAWSDAHIKYFRKTSRIEGDPCTTRRTY